MNLARRHNGFTALELLVCVAIALTLASLALCGLTQARSTAHRVQCLNNLRQYIVATLNYTADNGVYPLYQGYNPNLPVESAYSFWFTDLVPYLGYHTDRRHLSLLACPASETGHAFLDNYLRYGYNASGSTQMAQVGLGGFWTSESSAQTCREEDVKAPADMIALGDGIYAGSYSLTGEAVGLTDWLSWDKRTLEAGRPQAIRTRAVVQERKRHRGRYNIAFCDGHVEFIPSPLLFSSERPAKRRWNSDNEPH